MSKLKPFKLPTEEPLKLSLDAIFNYADKDQVHEVIFEPQRVEKPTETEGIPKPVVPAGSVVLFVFYRIAGQLERQFSYGFGKEALLEQLKKYKKDGWRIEFSNTEFGERAIAQRL
jgi:hypothetical protein